MNKPCPAIITPAAIHTDLGAIFVSLELSRSRWVVTSLSPGGAEKMSKHSVPGGDLAGLMERFRLLVAKANARMGRDFPIVTIQEAGLDGFWIHRALVKEGIESHVVDPASIATSRRRRRAKTDRIDGEALVRTLLAFKRGEPRVCAMVRAPSPVEEDARRIMRERKTLTGERVAHVNRIKGLLFAQGVSGYEPLRRDRRKRLEELRTGDGRELPRHLTAQILRELDRLELLLAQIKAVEAERDAELAQAREDALPASAALLLEIPGDRPGIRHAHLVGGSLSSLRQPTAGGRLCGPGADAVAERSGRPGTRGVEIRQSAAAHHDDPAGLALAAAPADIGVDAVVPRQGGASGWPLAQTRHRGAGAKAAGRTLEIRHRRCRDRRRHDETRLNLIPPFRNSTGPDQPRRIRVDEPGRILV